MGTANRDRQAQFKQRQIDAGKRQLTVWADPAQADAIKAMLAGEVSAAASPSQSALDELAAREQAITQREQDCYVRESNLHDAEQRLERQRSALAREEKSLAMAPKPGRQSKNIQPLPDRTQKIVQHLAFYGEGGERDRMDDQVTLAKAWGTEAKTTITKFATLVEILKGVSSLESGKARHAAIRFSSLVSEDEDRVLMQALSVLHRTEADIRTASRDAARINETRIAARKKRLQEANEAFETTFGALAFDDQVRMVAMRYRKGHHGYGEFADLMDALNKGQMRSWSSLAEIVDKARKARRSEIVDKAASEMKESGRSAIEVVREALEKFNEMKAKIDAEWGDLPQRVNTALVAEKLEKANTKKQA